MRILGLDPGLNHTGWGILDCRQNRFERIESGVINVPQGALSVRLGHIVRELRGIIGRTQPEIVSVEKVFVNMNPQSTLRLSQARAAALIAADLSGLQVLEYTPSEIKLAVTGTGSADKVMVQKMVLMLLKLDERLYPDEADALACAICGANRMVMQAYENQGATARTYATARHGRSAQGARRAWTQALEKKGTK